MAYDPQSARFSDIMLAIKNRLIEVFEVDPSLVKIAASDKYDIYAEAVGDLSFICRAYGPEPDINSGTGRRARWKTRRVRVYLYYRSSLDQAGDDETALTAEEAFFDLEDSVANALEDWFPSTVDNAPLTIEPLHPLDSTSGPPTRKEQDDTGYLRGYTDWEVKYLPRIETPAP